MKEMTACFTGHREIKHENCEKILIEIVENLINKGYKYFGAGGARGFDSLAEKVILTLKETKYPHIHLILVLPFNTQYTAEKGWSKEEIEEYERIKKAASKVVILESGYSRGVYYRRNEHLVNFSSVCISYQYKNTGGTAYTVNYANKKGLQIINVADHLKAH